MYKVLGEGVNIPTIFVTAMQACLETVYDPFPGSPAKELAEQTFTMAPRPMSRVPVRLVKVREVCLRMAAASARQQRNIPRALMVWTRSKLSMSVSAKGVCTPLST